MDLLAQVTEEDFNTNGAIASGFLFCSVKNIGSTIAEVNGVALAVGESKTYPFVGKGYPEIAYTVNGSVLRVMVSV